MKKFGKNLVSKFVVVSDEQDIQSIYPYLLWMSIKTFNSVDCVKTFEKPIYVLISYLEF